MNGEGGRHGLVPQVFVLEAPSVGSRTIKERAISAETAAVLARMQRRRRRARLSHYASVRSAKECVMWMRPIRCWSVAVLISMAWLAASPAAMADELRQASYEGTLGAQRIGLILDMSGQQVAPSRYYYLRHLTDIPLSGDFHAGTFTLREQTGTMTLHFVGNGSEHGQPFNFENSVGLEGEWSDGKQSLPVKLQGGGLFLATPAGHWYQSITEQTDDVFEARSIGFRDAVMHGNSAQAARFTHFPLRVNHGPNKHEQIHDAGQLTAQWKRLFPAGYVARIANASPHYMAIVQGYAMLGDGLVFFGEQGTEVLNVP